MTTPDSRTLESGINVAATHWDDSADARKGVERSHGRAIAGRAARVWGQHGRAGQERVVRRARLLVEGAVLRPGTSALELGCGTGEYTERLASSGASLTALDLVPELIDVARKRHLPPTVTCLLGDAEQLPFPDRSLDAVVGNAVLHHLRLGVALREVMRVLRAGGRCAFTEPNMLNPQVALQKNVPPLKRWLGDTPHETAFFQWQMRRELERAGLTVERVAPFDFLHPAIPDRGVPLARSIEAGLERAPLLAHIAGSLLIVARRA